MMCRSIQMYQRLIFMSCRWLIITRSCFDKGSLVRTLTSGFSKIRVESLAFQASCVGERGGGGGVGEILAGLRVADRMGYELFSPLAGVT